ncbi:response regulator [Natrinema gelatinilyticum]|uniref:response regulator n=1 Tax=Natrinema gelatinilyticum TaxID=2961571 RepID=UPI0020C3A00F|nr:response regulator [Natrinema gelatinilyticum]
MPDGGTVPTSPDTACECDESGTGQEILLVDDNPGDVRLIREAFRGVQSVNSIHVATDGREAINFIRQCGEFTDHPQPDLVLLEWQLPGADGEEVSNEIIKCSNREQIPVVVLIGFEVDEKFVSSFDVCADAYLTKPIGPTEFVALVRSCEYFWYPCPTTI